MDKRKEFIKIEIQNATNMLEFYKKNFNEYSLVEQTIVEKSLSKLEEFIIKKNKELL